MGAAFQPLPHGYNGEPYCCFPPPWDSLMFSSSLLFARFLPVCTTISFLLIATSKSKKYSTFVWAVRQKKLLDIGGHPHRNLQRSKTEGMRSTYTSFPSLLASSEPIPASLCFLQNVVPRTRQNSIPSLNSAG